MPSFSASHHAVIGQTSSWASCTSCTCKALDIMLAMHCANSILDFIDSFCSSRQKVPAMSLPYLLEASLMSQLRKVNFSSTHLCELYRAPVDRGIITLRRLDLRLLCDRRLLHRLLGLHRLLCCSRSLEAFQVA